MSTAGAAVAIAGAAHSPPATLRLASSVASDLHHHLQDCHSFEHLKVLHARLLRTGLDDDDFAVNLALRSCFAADRPSYARSLFESSYQPNLHLYNTMLRGLVAAGDMRETLTLYSRMRFEGLQASNFTFPFVLKACARLIDQSCGVKIHAIAMKSGFEPDVFVKTSLICFYARCGLLEEAQNLFDEMAVRNVVSWTAIISGYMENGKMEKAVELFRESMEMDLRPDSFTIVRVLSACSKIGDLRTGEWIHQFIVDKGMEKNSFVSTALIDVYMKCGRTEDARKVFDEMKERDVVSWSAMIGGYSSNGQPREALELFSEMQSSTDLRPDCYAMVGVLSACARIGALELGCRTSALMDPVEFSSNPVLGTALIDMHTKCGSPAVAWIIFKKMTQKDRIVWNAMITGFAMTGHGSIAFALFAQLEKLGVPPDGNTFVGLLCACTHAGFVEDGRRFFVAMHRFYSITPRIEHYGCIIDLLGRAGLLEKALRVIKEMPLEANAVVWGALLNGCRLHRNVNLAELVLNRMIELEPWNSGNYVLLSNIYTTSGRWSSAAKLRAAMKQRGIQKVRACSWVEVRGVVHEFLVGDKLHPMSEEIHKKLEELGKELKALGHVPTTEAVMFDVEEEEKQGTVGHHSEKLAVAFGLISLGPEETTVRVVKNLRVCGDCHAAIKLIFSFLRS